MPTIKLWNTELGKLDDYELSTDQNGDIVAEGKNDTIKFPGGISKSKFDKLVAAHNEANDGVKAIDSTEVDERNNKNRKLLESLE